MVTRRTDARRRRVLSEEFVPTAQDTVAADRKPMQAYSYGANRRNQPKTTDMIPKRPLSLGLFFLALATIAASLNLLAWFATPLAGLVGEAGSRALELSGAGTLANWICCLSLFLCSGICLQLFFLRRHKRDDYGGMYYVWLLMAGMFFLASLDCAVDLRTIFAKLFEAMTQRSLLQTPWLMMTIELIVLAVIVIRMLFEVRTSRFSLAAVLLVWLGFVGCIVLRNSDVAVSIDWLDQKVAYGNCILLGCVGSLAALVIYTRFVFLHAHGLIQLNVVSKQKAAAAIDDQPVESATKSSAKSKKKVVSEPAAEVKTTANTTPTPTPKPAVLRKTTKSSARSNVKSAKTTKEEPAAAKSNRKRVVTKQPPLTVTQPPPSAPQPTSKPAAAKKVAPSEPDDGQLQEELEQIETVSMSKSERRRLRKLAKRAARAKKAA